MRFVLSGVVGGVRVLCDRGYASGISVMAPACCVEGGPACEIAAYFASRDGTARSASLESLEEELLPVVLPDDQPAPDGDVCAEPARAACLDEAAHGKGDGSHEPYPFLHAVLSYCGSVEDLEYRALWWGEDVVADEAPLEDGLGDVDVLGYGFGAGDVSRDVVAPLPAVEHDELHVASDSEHDSLDDLMRTETAAPNVQSNDASDIANLIGDIRGVVASAKRAGGRFGFDVHAPRSPSGPHVADDAEVAASVAAVYSPRGSHSPPSVYSDPTEFLAQVSLEQNDRRIRESLRAAAAQPSVHL